MPRQSVIKEKMIDPVGFQIELILSEKFLCSLKPSEEDPVLREDIVIIKCHLKNLELNIIILILKTRKLKGWEIMQLVTFRVISSIVGI